MKHDEPLTERPAGPSGTGPQESPASLLPKDLPPGAVYYEKRDVDARPVLKAVAVVIGGTILIVAALLPAFLWLRSRAERAEPAPPPMGRHEPGRVPEGPRLQTTPVQDLAAVQAEDQRLLTSYGWVDEQKGIVHVPIDVAMRKVAERGLAAAGAAPSPSPSPGAASPGPRRRRAVKRLALAASLLLAAPLAHAQELPAGMPSSAKPQVLREVGYEQRLGEQVPLDIVLRDETGAPVRLADAVAGRPAVLSLVYYECPMLCTLTLNGLVSALTALPYEPGREFSLITVSFDERERPEQAQKRKQAYLSRYKRPGADRSWHFLTGDRAQLQRLTQAVGFRYAWDERTQQFAHPAGVVVLTPDGRIARYLYGVEYAPKDLRLGIVEASEGRIGSPVERLLLYCYQYDPAQGRYGAAVLRIVRAAGVVTLLAVVGFVTLALRRERQGHAARP